MALTKTELELVDTVVGALLSRRQVPEHLWDKVKLQMEVEGQAVTLVLVRAHWQRPADKVRSPVCQFRYTRSRDEWSLYWMRADGKWHRYAEVAEGMSLAELASEVDADPFGCFWG